MACGSYDADEGALLSCLQMASDLLYDLTGRQWPGLCTETIRPAAKFVRAPSAGWWPGNGFGPVDPGTVARGAWGSCTCNRAVRSGCNWLPEIRLADRVLSIEQVKIDGQVVPEVEYRLDDHRYLVGLQQANGQERFWPCCQREDLDDTEPHTFSVKYVRGGLPPIGGTLAAASLGCELAKGMGLLGDDAARKCRLPKRVTQITRQNVSVAVLDPLTLFQDGRTGLAEVDLWLESVRQGRARRRGTFVRFGRSNRPRHPG